MSLGKRKIYFIKKDFQSRFILRFVALATLWASTTLLLFIYLAGKRLDDLRYSSHIDIETTSELLLPVTVGVHLVSVFVFAGILAYSIKLLWRRLAPPLHALKRNVLRIAGGDLTGNIILRKNDEFQDLAGYLDGMRFGLRENIVKIKEGHHALSVAVAELRGSVLDGKPSLLDAASLIDSIERMKDALSSIRL